MNAPHGESGTCAYCLRPIVPDDIVPGGFRHADRDGTPTGWLCPFPYLTLAEPAHRFTLPQQSGPPGREPAVEPDGRRGPGRIPLRSGRDNAAPPAPRPSLDNPLWRERR